MRDLSEYFRAYQAYVLASVGWIKALIVMLIWLSGIFVPLGVKTFIFELPNWLAIAWMVNWSLLGYIFAPYGMWKYHRAQIAVPGVGRKAPQP
jgi:hypothetical protein